VNAFLPLHKSVRNYPAAQAVLSRISPVLSYYHALPLDDALQREWALLDTHDSLTDRYKTLPDKGRHIEAVTTPRCGGDLV
jgi:hypothetical protein